jgi:hypothetical protein
MKSKHGINIDSLVAGAPKEIVLKNEISAEAWQMYGPREALEKLDLELPANFNAK